MGLFGKLFEKKECAICGGEIGLLGNRKLEDGNMCKKCAQKLSPWFSERRHSTIAEIEQQLQYREENLQALQNFHPSYRIGENDKLIAEEKNGVPYRFVVAQTNDYLEENADLILFKDVSSCVIDVDENRRELYQKNDKGEDVSYNPPRYAYSYQFYVKLKVENNPYFSDITFKLNNFSVDVNPETSGHMPGQGLLGMLLGTGTFDPTQAPEYQKYLKMCREIETIMDAGRFGNLAQSTPEETAAAQEPPRPKFCPNCGAPVNGGKFCAQCGSQL